MSEIKQINTGVAELLAILLPNIKLEYKVYRDFFVMGTDVNDVDGKIKKIQRGDIKGFWRLPPVNWTPLGLSTELTEEQCREVVHRSTINTDFYYSYVCSGYLYFNESAKLVFDNIIKSYNITERTWLILKRLS